MAYQSIHPPHLEAKGNRPLQMNLDKQLKALIIYLKSCTSALVKARSNIRTSSRVPLKKA